MLARRLKEKGGASEKAPLAAGDEARSLQVEGVNVEEHKRLCPNMNDLKWVDQFPYVPSYRFHPYRSCFGATCSAARRAMKEKIPKILFATAIPAIFRFLRLSRK